jgi:hypothetical protein
VQATPLKSVCGLSKLAEPSPDVQSQKIDLLKQNLKTQQEHASGRKQGGGEKAGLLHQEEGQTGAGVSQHDAPRASKQPVFDGHVPREMLADDAPHAPANTLECDFGTMQELFTGGEAEAGRENVGMCKGSMRTQMPSEQGGAAATQVPVAHNSCVCVIS